MSLAASLSIARGASGAAPETSPSQRSLSSQASAPADAAACLQQLDEDVARDVRAAQTRAAVLQEEVDSLLARIAHAHNAAAAGSEDSRDPVLDKVEAIRRARRD
ncbi:hypothetical protein NESM_000745200 [Novymonas esmeraldas]|uniref:Uncharacterized protein n=1 Tax=Novymonas esmeraldas TaxID=1808958 RepID=A0AAW0EUT3_9TRYP